MGLGSMGMIRELDLTMLRGRVFVEEAPCQSVALRVTW